MVLTEKQEKQVKKMPTIESQLRKSKDGKYLIHRTVITHIRPLAYYKAILEEKEAVTVDELEVQAGSELAV